MKGKAIVKEIQIGGLGICDTLDEACRRYTEYVDNDGPLTKMVFAIELPSGEIRQITIRQEDEEIVAYGDFGELPSFLDYTKAVKSKGSRMTE